jgi:trigger factor
MSDASKRTKTSQAKQAKLEKIQAQEKKKKRRIIIIISIIVLLVLCFLAAALIYNAKNKKKQENGITISGNELGYDNDVVLGKYKGLTYTKTTFEVTDEDVEAYIDDVLDKNPNYTIDYSRDNTAVEASDSLKLVYSSRMNDITYEEDVELIYVSGSGILGDDFEDQIAGSLVGSTVEANVTLPEDYSKSKLAGNEVTLVVTIDSVVDITDELTDDYCSSISDGAYTTIDDYKSYVYDTLYSQKESAASEEDWKQIWDELVTGCELNIDDDAVTDAYDEMTEYYQSYADYLGIDLTELVTTAYGYGTLQDFYDYCKSYSEDVVVEQTIYDAIIEEEGITIDDDTYNSKVSEYMEEAGYSNQSDFESLMGIDDIKQMMAYDIVTDLILSSAVEE